MDKAQEQQLISDVLQYCQDRAIVPSDEESNGEHTRSLWNDVVSKFKDRYKGDIMDMYSVIVKI